MNLDKMYKDYLAFEQGIGVKYSKISTELLLR
jgi:hypothetical protein